MARTNGFPLREIALLVVAAIPFLAVGILCLKRIGGYSGPQFDHVVVNDYVLGGLQERLTLMAVGTVSGAAVVVCIQRIRGHYLEWRRGRDDSFAS